LPSFERAMLEASVLPISRILRLIGYDPATADDTGTITTVTRPRRTSRFYGITLKQIVAAGLLNPGTPVVSTNGAWPASGVITADGCVEVNGTAYDAPSAAAVAVKNGPANG
jgi:hypothetical protein